MLSASSRVLAYDVTALKKDSVPCTARISDALADVHVADYIPGKNIDSTWRQATVPMSKLNTNGIDLSKLSGIVFEGDRQVAEADLQQLLVRQTIERAGDGWHFSGAPRASAGACCFALQIAKRTRQPRVAGLLMAGTA